MMPTVCNCLYRTDGCGGVESKQIQDKIGGH